MVNIRGMLASEGMGACRSGKPDESYAKPLDGLLSEGIDRAVRFLFDKQTSYGEIAAYRFFNPQLAGASLLDSSPPTAPRPSPPDADRRLVRQLLQFSRMTRLAEAAH